MRRLRHPVATTLVGVVFGMGLVLGGVALGQSGGGSDLTGCLKNGDIYNVAIGENPLNACKADEIQVSWNSEGQPGSTWFSGPDTPTNTLGMDGDLYLHLGTGDVFVKESGTWVTQATLKGPQGAPGPQGPQGPVGPEGPAGLAPRAAFNSTADAPDQVFTLPVEITAPAPGMLIVSATVDAVRGSGGAGTNSYHCRLDRSNGATIPGTRMVSQVTRPDNAHEDCTTTGAMAVDAGTHTINFAVSFDVPGGDFAAVGGEVHDASVWALWVPYDGTGAIPAG